MKQNILSCLVILGVVYLVLFQPLWVDIFAIVSISLLVVLFICILIQVNKREKEVANYLDECDEKLKKGEMTKEANEQIHFYWEKGFFG